LITGFAVYLIARLTGHLVVLNAAGLVTSDRYVVGAAYTARVAEMHVLPGDTVVDGQIIARLESTEVLATLAQLAQNTAVIEAQQEAIMKRRRVVESLIPVAERRFAVAREGELRLAQEVDRNSVSQTFRSAIVSESFKAERDLATLQSELISSDSELASIAANLQEVRLATEATRQSYADGVVVASVAGTVSATVASLGQVLTAGEPVLELLNGSPFVLAYLTNGRLYNISPADRVILTDGVRTVDARVERIDIVADSLPVEFRTAFGAYERQQVMRVTMDAEMPFPYLSRVSVVSPWSPTHVVSWMKSVISY